MSRKQTPRELLFVFRPSSSCQHGCLRTIYSDDVLELIRQGEARISRASHVEPDDSGQWTADLSPVGGPILGPYDLRETALQAEVAWLKAHYL